MRGSFTIAEVAGIQIKIHITFLLLILIFGKWFFFVLAIFFFVTLHELAHSLVAKSFGIQVREITLLPIGGVASMTKLPDKPYQEFLISLAGPLTNIAIVVIFYFPLKHLVGPDVFFAGFRSLFGGIILTNNPGLILTEIYWINLMLAGFNLLPAFPMDGGRILRSLMAQKLGFQRATKVAVNFGHAFAILFGYLGLVQGRLMLLIIAVFIYMAAASEEMQVDVRSILRKFRARDLLPQQFVTVSEQATLSNVLELMFHSRQEDFPVVDSQNRMAGFVTRYDVMNGIHQHGVHHPVSAVMRRDVKSLTGDETLDQVQEMMQSNEIKALPVVRDATVIGIISTDDIARVYSMAAGRS
ncbi:MAG: site-2 protease family protein [Candidatus Omnitrophica bacterium]|nr:site-2 protease family protein [Candidatus Omnitrophota bacterium]